MPYNIKAFQDRYSLANKDIAAICKCSLPTIQKWRSGEVSVSGAAEQLMALLDMSADGSPDKLRDVLSRTNQSVGSSKSTADLELENLESSMTQVVDRLEYMLENRRRDKELAQSEARYQTMVDSFDNPVCRWFPDTTLTYANEAYRRLFKSEKLDITGERWINFLPEEIRESTEILVSDLVRRGQEETTIHEVLKADGNTAFFEWQDIPVKDETGKVVELHSVGYDITELIQLRGIKDESRLTKAAFFDLSGKALVFMDGEGTFLESNKVFDQQIATPEEIKDMGDLLPGSALGKLKRLLKRIRPKEAFNYQLKINKSPYRMSGRLIVDSQDYGSRFLVKFEEISTLKNQLTQLRLGNELVVDGTTRELSWSKAVVSKVQIRMSQLGNEVNVDRIYVFTIDWEADIFNNILEWCAVGVQAHIDDLQGFPISEYPWWIERIRKNQWIKFEDTAKMPRSAARERDLLVAQDIRSIMVAPLGVGDRIIGFVGFDHNITQRIWHAQEQQALDSFKSELEELFTKEQP